VARSDGPPVLFESCAPPATRKRVYGLTWNCANGPAPKMVCSRAPAE
jgi:hypothetical protein